MSIREQDDVRLIKSTTEIWTKALQQLEKKVKGPSFKTWICQSVLRELANGQATLATSNPFARDMVANTHGATIEKVLTEIVGEPIKIKVVVDPSVANETDVTANIGSITVMQPTDSPAKAAVNQLPPGATPNYGIGNTPNNHANLNPKSIFDNFVVGSDNRFCHSAALAVASQPGETYNPLFIYGGVGLGKTHLMQAIGHEILRHSPNKIVRYLSCEKFTNELINSIASNKMLDFRKRYRQVDVLLVDDIQFLERKETTQEEFFHTFNTLRESGKQIVLSSDRPPKALAQLEDRLRSRFEWGLIADVQPPDLETRIAILRKKRDRDNLQITDESLAYIGEVVTSNIRELEGALIRTHAYASLTGVTLSERELASILQTSAPEKQKKNITVEQIMDIVAAHYHVEPSDLRSAKRSQDLALPRHIAMYLANELLKMSYPRIGEAFGHRKHTSAIHACSKIRDQIAKDTEFARSVKELSRRLTD